MSDLTPSTAEVRSELRTLGDHAADEPDNLALERHARAVWTCLTEPGDGVAGALIQHLGARAALELVCEVQAGALVAPELADACERWLPRASAENVLPALATARRVNAALLMPGDPDWPPGLNDLGVHAPLALWARGKLSVLGQLAPSVAIVGARAASGYGEHVAAQLSGDLAVQGVSVVSGAAYGIDGAAHRAALGVAGITVAVLAGGIEKAYPTGHRDLLTQICRTGAVVGETPCGTSSTRWRFLQRNRLISAMSQATVVVEAGRRSGSINTAGHAAALGRPLGAVPGPITSAASAGCHRLFREFDATCITSADDVRELLGLDVITNEETPGHTNDSSRVIDALSDRSSRTREDIARRCGMDPAHTATILGLLELDGTVTRNDDGWRRRRRS